VDLFVVVEVKITRKVGHPVSPKVNLPMRVSMKAAAHKGAHGDIDPELFLHFPPQACLGGLTGFDFAPREFPLVRHAVPPLASGDENCSVFFQDGGCNIDFLRGRPYNSHPA
jgi:hypothetical protein